MKLNRRKFVAASVVSAAIGGARARKPVAPNETVRVGFIGMGGMGQANLKSFKKMPDVKIVAVCDVWEHNRNKAVALSSGKPDSYRDFRKVLDRKDVDAVVVSTPDHWHAPIVIAACDAGKDVYIEKPLCHTLAEGRKMVEVARRNGRVVQMGTQQRSGAHYKEAVDLIQSGKIGKVTHVHCWNYENFSPSGIGLFPPSEVPEGLDWNLWLGPAPKVPFEGNRFIWSFRWFWDYSGGMVTDWGTHHLDVVQWAMDVKGPRTAYAVGLRGVLEDNRETPDTLEVVFEYPEFICTYSSRKCNRGSDFYRSYGVEFFGTDATLYINREGFEVMPETTGVYNVEDPPYLRDVASKSYIPWIDKGRDRRSRAEYRVGAESVLHLAHVRNFLDCVKSRQRPVSDVETGYYSTSGPLLSNIALKLGRKIEWDLKNEQIVGDPAASRLLTKQYRRPWKV